MSAELTRKAREKGRIALVTGAGRGIGLAISDRLSRDGHLVVRSDLSISDSVSYALNVRDPGDWERVVSQITADVGPIAILINNAGIAGRAASVWELEPEEWRDVIDIDLSGVFYGCRAVLPSMRSNHYGRVVNIASIAGKEGNPLASAYSAAKAGVIALTKAVAKEVTQDGILVNCVTPAVIDTEMVRQTSDGLRNYMISRIPLGRTGTANEVAALVSWLASGECSFSTGAVFDISGGRATY